MVDLYEHFSDLLAEATMFAWHRLLLSGDTSIKTIGGYRTHDDPMRIVSGRVYQPTVHFEAPPSKVVPDEMQALRRVVQRHRTARLNTVACTRHAPGSHTCISYASIPSKTAMAVSGAPSRKSPSPKTSAIPSLIALAYTIERKRKDYYAALERNNKDMEVTDWLTISPARSSKPNRLRSGASISMLPRQSSTNAYAISSMSGRRS